MKISKLAAVIIGISAASWSIEAQAHSCKGLKSAHCSCTATLGVTGALLASKTDHNSCYNQQANMGHLSNCMQHCSTALGYLQPAADAALKAAKICGSQTVVMKFSAGTNLPTPWSSQQRIGCSAPPGSSGGKSAGTSPIVRGVLDSAKGTIVEGVKK